MTKRIAIISEHASPLAALGGTDCGGQNVYVAHLALELAERGHLVDVFTRRDCADTRSVVQWAPRVRVVHVDAGPARCLPKEKLLPFMPAFAKCMMEFAERSRIRYDVLHANFWTSGIAASLVKQSCDIPFVVTFHALGRVRRLHQGAADGFPEERGDIEEWLAETADAVIAECPQDADDLATLYRARPERLRIVPCGVDRRRFHPVPRDRARQVLRLEPHRPTLLQLGRMVPRKGIDDAIRALCVLRTRHGVDARLLIVGGATDFPDETATPHLRELRQVADACDVGDAVQFVGRRGGDVLRYLYSAADAFITTPWYEPFGITPLEAMACGTPVIGSNVGGIKFSVIDGETGFLVPPRDPAAIADRAAKLIADPQLRATMSRQAVTRVNSHFQWRSVAAAIDGVYTEVIRGGTSRVERIATMSEGRA